MKKPKCTCEHTLHNKDIGCYLCECGSYKPKEIFKKEYAKEFFKKNNIKIRKIGNKPKVRL